MTDRPHLYAIGLGSNRMHGRHGAPARVVAAGMAALDERFDLYDASPVILSRAVGPAGRDFANAAALVESALEPPAMLAALKAIERAFGRRAGQRWGARVLDLDILAWSGGRFASRRLTIPHPLLATRDFALFPLATIAGHWPAGHGQAVRHLAARLRRSRPRPR